MRHLIWGVAAALTLTPWWPAAAATPICPAGNACLWTGAHFTGVRWQSPANTPVLPAVIDNQAQSAANGGTRCGSYLWSEPFYGGTALILAPGERRDGLPTGYDGVSSVSFVC